MLRWKPKISYSVIHAFFNSKKALVVGTVKAVACVCECITN